MSSQTNLPVAIKVRGLRYDRVEAVSGNFAFWLGSVSVLFTSYYSFRLLFLTFLVPTNSFGRDRLRCHDAPIPMAIPSILLAIGSLFVGYLAKV